MASADDDHEREGLLVLGVAMLSLELPGDQSRLPATEGRLRLGEKVGAGKFGAVFEAEDHLDRGARLVAKAQDKYWAALEEVQLMQWASRRQGRLPRVLGLFAGEGDSVLLVMQRLRCSLEELRRGPARTLEPVEVRALGIEAIRSLQGLHECGVLHRDITPHNLMVGAETSGTGSAGPIYIVDFGLARHFRVAGQRVDLTKKWRGDVRPIIIGSVRFCSVRAHQGLHEPLNDLESLAYVLISLALGALPWDGCKGRTKYLRNDNIFEVKQDAARLEEHVRAGLAATSHELAEALLALVQYCRDSPDSDPDYARLIALLEAAGQPLPVEPPRGTRVFVDDLPVI